MRMKDPIAMILRLIATIMVTIRTLKVVKCHIMMHYLKLIVVTAEVVDSLTFFLTKSMTLSSLEILDALMT